MTVNTVCRGVLAAALIAASLHLSSPVSLGQSSTPTPVAPTASVVPDVETQLTFLRTAKVIASRPIGKGVTGAKRVTLSDGSRTHDAAFQSVADEPQAGAMQLGKRRMGELRFVDAYRYNIAAWRISRLLGIEQMMPATVERAVGGTMGALSWWVDDVLMDEQEREQKDAQPPSGMVGLARQRQTMWIFGELVRDTDRNKGNVVYTTDWRVVMLDFTRAFRLQKTLTAPATLNGCNRVMFTGLRALTERELKDAVEHHLTAGEVQAVMARRDLLVRHFDRLIAERGEAAVLY